MELTSAGHAAKLFQSGHYEEAAEMYSHCLDQLAVAPQDKRNNAHIALLFNRAACNSKLKKFETAVEDYDKILSNDRKNSKALAKKAKSLAKCKKFVEALESAKLWLEGDPQNIPASEEVKKLEIVVCALQDQDNDDDDDLANDLLSDERISPEGRDYLTSPNEEPPPLQAPNEATNIPKPDDQPPSTNREEFNCSFCGIKFATQTELKTHCRSDLHKKKIVDDEGRTWKYRDPPRGLTSEEYTKCPRYFGDGTCRFGSKCSQAHSDDELTEWKERFEYKRQQLQKAKESELHGNGFADTLMEKWMNAEAPESVMSDSIPGVKVYANSDLTITMSSKKSAHAWIFTLTSRLHLHRVVLLDESTHRHFHCASITIGPKKNQRAQKLEDHCQEWINSNPPNTNTKNETVYRIKVAFRTDIYGTFRQTIVFDFGSEPVLCQNLCVDSNSVADFEKLAEDLVFSEIGRWDLKSKAVVKFEPAPQFPDAADQDLMSKYPIPSASQISQSKSLQSSDANTENYKQRMHDLLAIEEMAQFSSVAKYNVKTVLHLTTRFMLMPSLITTAKYAVNGELFAQLDLTMEVSEDTSHGRLILQNVHTVLIAPYDHRSKVDKEPTKVFEAMVEDRGKSFIFLRLSGKCVEELGLKTDQDMHAHVQFWLNRAPMCEMHLAVDRLPDASTVFPDVTTIPNIPWTPQRQWSENLDSRLNLKQKEAVVAITTVLSFKLPPVLLIGPYGTGKTFTLAQAALQILKQQNTRILICTHSNSAADLYIKDYFHPYVEDDHEEARPLRVMYKYRWMNTVSTLIQTYCLIEQEGHSFRFRSPAKEDIEKHRIVVTTLSSSRSMYDIGLEKDFFTHILIDEAAQAVECETIMPLTLAGDNTRIVLAGDHMQMSPEVHSDFARQHGFHVSLIERLFDIYPSDNPCKILLCENYRSHKAIIDFTSDLFYEKKLVASGTQPEHDTYYPLTFFTARGEDVQHQNSTGFYNNSEVFEIAERVTELQKSWPKAWGQLDENSIGVVSPYVDQVARIRSELRKRKMHMVSVERVFNVQGKQFRVIILSTVRTRNTCSMDSNIEDVDYGFLSNVKLLNTAITRAQSLVAVVGDPVSLCTIGKCRKVWETFLEICHQNSSLYGMTWSQIRNQLDGVELKKTYVLNPLAPEFIPNRLRHGSDPQAPLGYGPYGYIYTPAVPRFQRQNVFHTNVQPNPYLNLPTGYLQQLQMYAPLPYNAIPLLPRYLPCVPPPPQPLPPQPPAAPPPHHLHNKFMPRPAGMSPEMAVNPTSSAITTNTNYTVVSVNQLTNTSDAEPLQASGTQGKLQHSNKMTSNMKTVSTANNHIVASSSNLVHPSRPGMAPVYQNHSMQANFQGLPMMPVQANSWQDIPGHLRQHFVQPQQTMRQNVPRNTTKNVKHDHRHGHDLHKFGQEQPVNHRNNKKPEDAVIQNNPHLQREMYSYLLQKEGPEAAHRFIESLQQCVPKAPQSYEGEPLFKHHAQMTNALKEVSMKEGMPIVQSGVRHDPMKPKNNSPVRSLYRKDGSVIVSVSQNDQMQRVRHSSSKSTGEGENSKVITWQTGRPKDPPLYPPEVMPQKHFSRFPNASVQFDTCADFRPEQNCISSNRAHAQQKGEPCKTTAATVNVASFLDPEQTVSSVHDDLLYLDSDAPSGVDHVVRFIQDSIDMDDSDSDSEQSRYFPRKKKTNSSGNLTMVGAIPTYAGILRGDTSKTPGRMRHMSAPQTLYSGESSVFGPSGMTTSNGARLHERLPHQHSSGNLYDISLGLDVNSDCFNRIPSYNSSQTSLHQEPVNEENVSDPLDHHKNLNFNKSYESTYKYFK
ncbi:probable helicase with zinc finger domain isoform X2 [Lineus longissimus]|uniref:probable helicase with zinc finger domain isoform X2 n=1 Tax=Lineus longissimus TaxID=88925 RepID=UPI00315C54DF